MLGVVCNGHISLGHLGHVRGLQSFCLRLEWSDPDQFQLQGLEDNA